MDQLQISPETQQGLQNLSAKDKQELNQFIVGETQKAQVQSSTSRPPSLHECAFTRLAHACLYHLDMLTSSCSHSRAQLRLLQEVHHRPLVARHSHRKRGYLHEELCRPLHGCQHDDHQEPREDEDLKHLLGVMSARIKALKEPSVGASAFEDMRGWRCHDHNVRYEERGGGTMHWMATCCLHVLV